jgi:hypothetical protein
MSVIISGCGGGYDVFGGIPLYLENKNLNLDVLLINLSFTQEKHLKNVNAKKLCNNFYVINANNIQNNINFYFPEYYLSKQLCCDVYIILVDSTIQEIHDSYKYLLESHNVKKIYLVDGGCDVLLRGDEFGLATPVEDMMHFYAINMTNIKEKYICAIGLNVDVGEDVLESELVDRLDYLDKKKIIINKQIWNLNDDKIKRYFDMVKESAPQNTVVQSLICASLQNKTGYYLPQHLKLKIRKSRVNLSDLTKTFITCNFNKLYNDNLYIQNLTPEDTRDLVDAKIEYFIASQKMQ